MYMKYTDVFYLFFLFHYYYYTPKEKRGKADFHPSHISSRCTRMRSMYLRREQILLKEISVESFSAIHKV